MTFIINRHRFQNVRDTGRFFRWNLLEENARDNRYNGKELSNRFRPAEFHELAEAVFGKAGSAILSERDTAAIRIKWEQIAGPLHAHSVPEKIDNNILYINCNKSVHVQEFQFNRKNICEKIRLLTGINIQDIRPRIRGKYR